MASLGWNLYILNSAGEDEQVFYEKSSDVLYRYITGIYVLRPSTKLS